MNQNLSRLLRRTAAALSVVGLASCTTLPPLNKPQIVPTSDGSTAALVCQRDGKLCLVAPKIQSEQSPTTAATAVLFDCNTSQFGMSYTPQPNGNVHPTSTCAGGEIVDGKMEFTSDQDVPSGMQVAADAAFAVLNAMRPDCLSNNAKPTVTLTK